MSASDVAIGSRGSALALAQAMQVHDAFEANGHRSRVVIIETEGDRRAPDTAWGEGAFVAAIERALLAGRVDVAVHSAKDVPTDQDPRLRIAAYLPRADPRDALVLRTDAEHHSLATLPHGTRVGTDSPRRTGFLLAHRPDLVVHPLHGNVDTRLRRLDAGETDALVLACAGLDRLGLGGRIAERLEPEIVPPAPGQGAIAIQIRQDDAAIQAIAAAVNDRQTQQAVEAERAFLVVSGGGCRAPIGALATVSGDSVDIVGGYATPDGRRTAIGRRHGQISSGQDLGRDLAAELERDARIRAPRNGGPGRRGDTIAGRVMVTRAADQATELVSRLGAAGLDAVSVPAIAVEIDPPRGALDTAAGLLHTYRWVVITSANGARAILKAAERILTELAAPSWAAIGSATRGLLEREGIEVAFQPTRSLGTTLAAELPGVDGSRVLVVRGDRADSGLALALRARGAEVDDVIGYRTREAPEGSGALLRAACESGRIEAVVFTSGSTIRGLVKLAERESIDVRSIPAACIGPETADEARQAGFRVIAVSPTPEAAALARATADVLSHQPQEMR